MLQNFQARLITFHLVHSIVKILNTIPALWEWLCSSILWRYIPRLQRIPKMMSNPAIYELLVLRRSKRSTIWSVDPAFIRCVSLIQNIIAHTTLKSLFPFSWVILSHKRQSRLIQSRTTVFPRRKNAGLTVEQAAITTALYQLFCHAINVFHIIHRWLFISSALQRALKSHTGSTVTQQHIDRTDQCLSEIKLLQLSRVAKSAL